MANKETTMELHFSDNLITSKSFQILLSLGQVHPTEIVDECLQELITGLKLNTHDIPFYIMALEILHTSLYTHIDKDGPGEEIINHLRSHSEVVTTHEYKSTDKENNDE